MKKIIGGYIFVTILILFLPTVTFAYENESIENSKNTLEVSVEITEINKNF